MFTEKQRQILLFTGQLALVSGAIGLLLSAIPANAQSVEVNNPVVEVQIKSEDNLKGDDTYQPPDDIGSPDGTQGSGTR